MFSAHWFQFECSLPIYLSSGHTTLCLLRMHNTWVSLYYRGTFARQISAQSLAVFVIWLRIRLPSPVQNLFRRKRKISVPVVRLISGRMITWCPKGNSESFPYPSVDWCMASLYRIFVRRVNPMMSAVKTRRIEISIDRIRVFYCTNSFLHEWRWFFWKSFASKRTDSGVSKTLGTGETRMQRMHQWRPLLDLIAGHQHWNRLHAFQESSMRLE